MKRYALIGRRLGHSYSQQWFTALFTHLGLEGYRYDLCEMASIEGLHEWVRREGICGLNVTVPFKRDVIAELDALDDTASAIGAVNCITVEDGRLIGHNTDAQAFAETLLQILPTVKGMETLVLGTGGAARAVAHASQSLCAKPILVSRHPDANHNCPWPIISYSDIHTVGLHRPTIIVNATPVGMFPDIDTSPIERPATFFSQESLTLLYDLVYNPTPTLLMKQAASWGVKTADGLSMLHRQAELSWELFKNK